MMPHCTDCTPVLPWLENALRAERHAVDLALALRHVALLKELAPHLEGLEYGASSAKLPLGFAASGAAGPSFNVPSEQFRNDRHGYSDNELSVQQPLQGWQELPPPRTPSSIRSFELQDNEDHERNKAVQDPTVVYATQQLTVPTKNEEVFDPQSPRLERTVTPEQISEVLDRAQEIKESQQMREVNRNQDLHDDADLANDRFPETRRRVRKLLVNQRFDYAVGIVIVVNSVCMGIETSFEIDGKDTGVFQVMEHFFLAVYCSELSLHFFAYGLSALRNPWVAFDFSLVCTGALSLYVIGPILDHISTGNPSLKDSMGGLLVMRMLRLFRLARALRVLVMFKTLWMLVRGLIGSAETITYTFGLILLILYIFACMALELITKKMKTDGPPEVQLLVQERFPNMMVTMLTLMQFVSMDSISSIYFPLVMYDPTLIFFFLPFILVVSISLMNLVTAVIVEGAIEQGKQDREAQSRYKMHAFNKILPSLRALFHDCDVDQNGTVTLKELNDAPEELRKKLEEVMQADSLTELFEMVDVDESGEVDIDEFCDGIAKIVNSDSPVELIRILKHLSILRKSVHEIQACTRRLETLV